MQKGRKLKHNLQCWTGFSGIAVNLWFSIYKVKNRDIEIEMYTHNHYSHLSLSTEMSQQK